MLHPLRSPGLCPLTDLPRYACGYCTGIDARAREQVGRRNTMPARHLGRCEYCDGCLAGRFLADWPLARAGNGMARDGPPSVCRPVNGYYDGNFTITGRY